MIRHVEIFLTADSPQALRLHGFTVQTLQGSDAIAERQGIVDEWSSKSGSHILIISSVAMTGLNLSAARILVLYVCARS